MVAVEYKILVVVKGGGGPFLLRMALQAVAGNLLVQRISRGFVAGLALIARGFLKQVVVKRAGAGKALDTGMVAVAGHAVLAAQLLVEGGLGGWLG